MYLALFPEFYREIIDLEPGESLFLDFAEVAVAEAVIDLDVDGASNYLEERAAETGLDPGEGIRFTRSLQTGDLMWVPQLAALAGSLRPTRIDDIAIYVSMNNAIVARLVAEGADEEEIDQAIFCRRMDVVLESIHCSMALLEVRGAISDLGDQLLEAARTGTVKVLESPWTQGALGFADGFQMAFTGFPLRLSNAAAWSATKLGPSLGDVALELAEMLLGVQTAQFRGDLEPARRLKGRLRTELHDLSQQKAGGDQDSEERQRGIQMVQAALIFVTGLLGDDEDAYLDVAPEFVGMRLSEARAIAATQSISLIEGDVGSETGRTVMRSSNWVVAEQDPMADHAVGKLRQVRVSIHKSREVATLGRANDT